jgi:hypothetical protein
MAKIPSRKFSKSIQKIASRGFSKSKSKIPSRGFAKGTAKIPSRKFSTAMKPDVKPEAPVLLERPTDEKARQDRLANLKSKLKLTPASDLQSP